MSKSYEQPLMDRSLSLLGRLINDQIPGQNLAQPFYTEPEIFKIENIRIFTKGWLLAGHVSQIPEKGEYFLFKAGSESIIVVRDNFNVINACFNICKHRGSLICLEDKGTVNTFRCPYHSWIYSLSGELLQARAMPPNFSPEQSNLERCAVKIVEGFIFINLSPNPIDFHPISDEIAPFLSQHGFWDARICYSLKNQVRANWKLLIENFEECYHCLSIHPEYSSVMAHAKAESIGEENLLLQFEQQRAEWEKISRQSGHKTGVLETTADEVYWAGRFPLRKGFLSQSKKGKSVAPLMGKFKVSDGGITSVRFYPLSYIIASCDYAVLIRFNPLEAALTEIEISWLIDKNAVEEVDYHLDDLIWFWKTTAEQDNSIAEINQLGVNSIRYKPNYYSEMEEYSLRFINWYLRQMVKNQESSS